MDLYLCNVSEHTHTHTHTHTHVPMQMENIERYIHKVVNLSYSGQVVMGLDVNWQGQEEMPNIKC